MDRQKPTLTRSTPTLTADRPKLMRNAPDFESTFDDGDGNPFADIEATGDLQTDVDETMSEALRLLIQKKKASMERYRVATDSEFFFCVCFQSREQKEAFLKLAGWDDIGDKYLDGLEIARRLKIQLEIIPIEPLKIRGKPHKFRPTDILGGEGKEVTADVR